MLGNKKIANHNRDKHIKVKCKINKLQAQLKLLKIQIKMLNQKLKEKKRLPLKVIELALLLKLINLLNNSKKNFNKLNHKISRVSN